MKKLIAALAVCLGTAALAQDANQKVDQAQQAQQEKKRDATQVFTQEPGDAYREAQRDAEQGIDATQVGSKIRETAKDIAGIQTEQEGTFKAAQAFNMKGTLKDSTLEGVTIERPGLPAADLDVRDKTVVMLDGKRVKVDAIPEGAPVQAKFQLEGQDIVAVELRATSPKGAKTPAGKPMKRNEGKGGAGMMDHHEGKGGAGMMDHHEGKGGAGMMQDDARELRDEAKGEAKETRDELDESLK